MFVRTERLGLRRFTTADAEAFAAYRSAPEVARYQSWEAPVSLPAAVALVADFSEGDLARAVQAFAGRDRRYGSVSR